MLVLIAGTVMKKDIFRYIKIFLITAFIAFAGTVIFDIIYDANIHDDTGESICVTDCDGGFVIHIDNYEIFVDIDNADDSSGKDTSYNMSVHYRYRN